MPSNPTTPPRHVGSLPPNPKTPEQVRRTEEARLRAKALRAQHDALNAVPQASSTSSSGQKRPHSQISTTVPTSVRNAAGTMTMPAGDAAIRPAKKFDKFIEYDFSKMSDTKGGFLSAADDPHNRALHLDAAEDPAAGKPPGMSMEEWERHVLLKQLRANRQGPFEPGLNAADAKGKEKGVSSDLCRECGSLEVDWKWIEVFECAVCPECKEKYPEKYSLLTKTEAREDYLLTNPELQDVELLPHLKRPNPHKSTWNDMQLYLRYQVEQHAFSAKKWGSAEALDAEFERRQIDKKVRKEKKFKSKLADLKKRTRLEAHRRARMGAAAGEDAQFGVSIVGRHDKHIHEWGRPTTDPETGAEIKTCVDCGMECEEINI